MILKKHLLKEILQNFFSVFLILILVVISLRFVRYLGDAAAGETTATIIYQMLILKLITSMKLIVPLSFYLSLFMSMGRMRRDNELIAIASAGIGRPFFIRSVSQVAMGFVLLLFGLTFYLAPWAEHYIDELDAKANQESDLTGISAGRFKEFNKGNRVLYVEALSEDEKEMHNVFLQVRKPDAVGVLTSDTAKIHIDNKTRQRTVIFTSGKQYLGTPGKNDYSITDYSQYEVHLDPAAKTPYRNSLSKQPFQELLNSDDPLSKIEIHWRLAEPLSLLLLAIFAVLASLSTFSEKGYLGLVSATLLYFVFNNLLNIAHDMVIRGNAAAFPNLWWPHLLLLVIILILYYQPIFKHREPSVFSSKVSDEAA